MRKGIVAVLVILAACGDDSYGPDGAPPPPDAAPLPDATPDILAQLQAIPGLTIVGEEDQGDARFFRLTFTQPVDHAQPGGAAFTQRLTLLHRSHTAPTVLALSGYYLWDFPYEEEPTAILRANQLQVEHRFFTPSRPEPPDWSFLTIRQAADDHHRIVTAFRTIYHGAWISTGASKGGMTAVYHRRFHPDDVDGTVAYVAPISFGAPDDRYLPFFDTVGEVTCRYGVISFQREVLNRRTAIRALMDQQTMTGGWTYNRLGADVAFESAVTEAVWMFWQYWGVSLCDDVPFPSATDDHLYSFLESISTVTSFSDQMIEYYEPYYYQAVAELGYPSVPEAPLADLLYYEDVDTIPAVLPFLTSPAHDPAVMQDVADWVAAEGSELLFVYGEWDPWTAGAFELGGAVDSFRLVVPDGTHTASISALPGGDRTLALDALARWAGTEASMRPAPRWHRPPPPRFLPPIRPALR